ncbi:MAG TPA: NADH-quinone oxidoreductase subunit J [Candidatus Acidoferrales bacterium]|nr:NADH-quinone oxidoreductase subunit J [Candidatus Acidoferrales bacterium]
MNPELVVFFFLAALLIGFSLLVILVRNPVHSALALVAALFMMAIFFLRLSAPMVAALQVLVYAGAVMVLFLFVIMLLNPANIEPKARLWWAGVGAACALFVLALVGRFLTGAGASPASGASLGPGFGSPQALAQSLFGDFVLPFEIASIVLLVAIIGAVALARRGTP